GESISEVFIGEWYVSEGTWVDVDTNLVGLETDKATFDVPSPTAGILKSIARQAGETAEIGEVIAHIEPGEKPSDGSESAEKKPAKAEPAAPQKSSQPTPAASSSGGKQGGHVMPAAA